eukprot:CAMPEP_0181314766 /NCGR_PEP_ID=MMETSP1101-20121128/14998_1 /TAXON_ID=46948 /ORGANISM="Rhodomonas abbreviata, Strain Caron Lab Isolate" /LENGTH=171 /DNA_ID=CAMNT_0023421891 /DNA_START=25 /DNA_END=540 /DNA_ORIENTATION=-
MDFFTQTANYTSKMLGMSSSNYQNLADDGGDNMAGVGIVFRTSRDGSLKVRDFMKGSSAEGKVCKGDVLSKVADFKVLGAVDSKEISNRMLGKLGSPVQLTFLRDEREVTVTIVRTMQAASEPTLMQKKSNTNKLCISHLTETDVEFERARSDAVDMFNGMNLSRELNAGH